MEYIPNGNLEKRIPFLKKSQKIKIMLNILQGLTYLHNRLPYSLIHRDIKSTNIFLTYSKVAKITDFGLSKFNNIYKKRCDTTMNIHYKKKVEEKKCKARHYGGKWKYALVRCPPKY